MVTLCTTRFNTQKFYVLPTELIAIIFMDVGTNDYSRLEN
jgi:hypothetical protein